MRHIEKKISGTGDIRLFTQRHEVETPLGAVVILHGYCEHSLRYGHVVERFTKADLNCYLLDHRGHGRSDGPRAAVMRFEEYLEDLDVFMEEAGTWYSGGPVFLLGHSMGGLMAAMYILTRKTAFKGFVLSSPFFGMKVKVPAVKFALGKTMSRLWPSLSLASEIDPHLLTHDEAIVEDYISDPNVPKIANVRWFTEAMDAKDYAIEHAAECSIPALVMHGGDDRIADPEATRFFFKRMGRDDSKLVIHEGLYHEIFNEIDRERVLDMTVDWLLLRIQEG